MKHFLLKFLFVFILTLLGIGNPLLLNSQIPGPFVPSGKDFNWKYLSTDNFDLHFSNQDPVLASAAARFAEEALLPFQKRLITNTGAGTVFFYTYLLSIISKATNLLNLVLKKGDIRH